jgi:hypothetical protein
MKYVWISIVLLSMLLSGCQSASTDNSNAGADQNNGNASGDTSGNPAGDNGGDNDTVTNLLGVNVSWFNTWNESQPLANVASTGRGYPGAIPADSEGQPTSDFDLLVYEGATPGEIGGAGGGAQYGEHLCRFKGQADLTASGGTLSDVQYDTGSNTTTFTYTTTEPTNSIVHFTNTRRDPSDATATGLLDLEMMRPGSNFGDLLNTAFVQAMKPFTAFRVGPNWDDFTYSTDAPVWAERAKPDGLFSTGTYSSGLAPWEILAAMANEMNTDLWICLPPNADDSYLTKIFQVFYYGSDGINPYTSPQTNPIWEPLNPDRKLYFEVGNEIWNWANPYGAITTQMMDQANAEIAAGDSHHYNYAPADTTWMPIRRRVAWLTANASQLCRNVVGDVNMMTRFRPVLAGQSAYPYIGRISISYLKCVLGGHGYHNDNWAGGFFPGEYEPDVLLTPEDGVSLNQFGNVAHPITYWIYGYAVAPYINGASITELSDDLDENVKNDMLTAIQDAQTAGVEVLAYEGGIETYHSYDENGLDTVIGEMLNYWYDNGGGLFMYYALAGNNGSGIYPDLTRQDPAVWPKVRAIWEIAGLYQLQ